jgi:hypothetical protein
MYFNFESDVTTLEEHLVLILRSSKSQEARLKAKIEKRARRDLYEGSKLLEQKKKRCVCNLFYLTRILSIFWFKPILQRTVHEGELGYYLSCFSFMCGARPELDVGGDDGGARNRAEGHTAEQQRGVSVVYKQRDTGSGNRQA